LKRTMLALLNPDSEARNTTGNGEKKFGLDQSLGKPKAAKSIVDWENANGR